MGKKEPENTYETIKDVKKARLSGGREGVRYVKDPLTNPPNPGIGEESRYAFHITYHHDQQEGNDSHYSTKAGFTPTPPPLVNTNNPLLRSHTLPHGLSPNQTDSLNSQTLGNSPQRALTQVRSLPDKSRRVGFVGNDDAFTITQGSTYTTERLRHFTEEGNLGVQHDRTSRISENDFKHKVKGKEGNKEKKGCTCPPWWAWLIIILVTCLLAAVVYFVFGQLLKSSPDVTSTSTSNPQVIINVTSPSYVSSDVTASPSSSSTTQLLQSSSTSRQTTTTTPTTTTTTSTTQSTTTTTTVRPSSTVKPAIGDEVSSLFTHNQNTRSLRSQSSTRVETQSTTLQDCFGDCQSNQPTCFGIDFNEQWFTCHLMTLYDYGLEPLGGDRNIQNYRRNFRVKSFCQEALYFHSGRTFTSAVSYRNLSADSLSKCREICFGSFGSGLQGDGYRCSGGVFNRQTKRCLITDEPYNHGMLRDHEEAVHFINDEIECIEEPKAACSIKFAQVKNHEPYDTNSQSQLTKATTVPECGSRCIQNASCHGFIFRYSDSSCRLYTGPANTALGPVTDADFYGRNPPKCERCGYVLTKGQGVSSSLYQDVRNQSGCENLCNNWHRPGENCYGYDWTESAKKCQVVTTAEYTLEPASDTDHYQKDPVCNDCKPTEFISTSHTSPIGGSLYRRPTSLSRCARICQQAAGSDINRRCYGFTFDRSTYECYLFHAFGYDLNSIGISQDSDHFRRKFACSNSSTLCNKYDKTANTKGTSTGILQPWDISTVAACFDRCWGYGLSLPFTCYGVDFNQRTATCTVYTDQDYVLGSIGDTPGTDHYKRQNC